MEENMFLMYNGQGEEENFPIKKMYAPQPNKKKVRNAKYIKNKNTFKRKENRT